MDIVHFFSASPLAFILLCTLLGLMVGSFINVVIHRLPIMMDRECRTQCGEYLGLDAKHVAISNPPLSPLTTQDTFNLTWPPSHCPQCRQPLRWIHNIPIVSYLWLRGQCANCKQRISIRYPLIELVCAILAAVAAYHFQFGWQALFAMVLLWSLVALSMIDFDHQQLPDVITLPVLWIGLGANIFGLFTPLNNAVWGAIAGYLVLWALFHLFKWLTGKEGMGYGDFKLLAMLGAWMGLKFLPIIIVTSSFVGSVVGIGLIVFKNVGRDYKIPFGPYLALGGIITLFWGDKILQAYWSYLGL